MINRFLHFYWFQLKVKNAIKKHNKSDNKTNFKKVLAELLKSID